MLMAVIDTNVVVSGVLAGTGPSPNARNLDAMGAVRLHFALSEALLVEYRRVLLRPAIARRHGLTEVEIDQLLESLVVNALLREAPIRGEADPPPGELVIRWCPRAMSTWSLCSAGCLGRFSSPAICPCGRLPLLDARWPLRPNSPPPTPDPSGRASR